MANDPQYVRLVDRMARSTQVDLNSGWGIAGLDVKEFPEEDQLAAAYVRDAIRRGTIEPCSRAEFDEVNGDEGDFDFLSQIGVEVEPIKVEGHFQEGHIAALAEEKRHQLESARGLSSGGASFGDEKVRKAALLRAQKALDEGKPRDEVEDDASGKVDPEEAAKVNKEVDEEQQKSTTSRRGRGGAQPKAVGPGDKSA